MNSDPFQRLETALRFPDLWQQEAVTALRAGRDVVVHAPTGAGKTYVFELLYPSLKGQAVFTVPTRALANDKLAEWRTQGWDVGITTGDVSENPRARVVVATLETQRERLLRGDGPRLFVVDEYQMLADTNRGAHYELALALAQPSTQLLLLSGSVANPQDVVDWLRRLGRDALLVRHDERPVPLEEVSLDNLPGRVDDKIRTFWPRLVAKALMNELGPILVFIPRRAAAEALARELASALPCDDPLPLSADQAAIAGEGIGKLLRRRIAYHHSGLSYALRAGLIEPLAKAGQLRAVVATTGLAAGVNFSLRSVLITDTRYAVRGFERHLQPEELLQMFGRAGRRGLDERGFVLVAPGRPRLGDARPRVLRRGALVDWPTLVAVMAGAAESQAGTPLRGVPDSLPARAGANLVVGKVGDAPERRPHLPPFAAARRLCESLFSAQTVPLGVERCLDDGPRPCGLWVDAERARLAQPLSVEIEGSRGEWEPAGESREVPLRELWVREEPSAAVETRREAISVLSSPNFGARLAITDAPLPMARPPSPIAAVPLPMDDVPLPMDDVPLPMDGAPLPMDGAPLPMDGVREALAPSSVPFAPRPIPHPRWRRAGQSARFFQGIGSGNLARLRMDDGNWLYGRELPLAVELSAHEVRLAKGLRPTLETLGEEWRGRNFPPGGRLGRAVFGERILPLVPVLSGGGKLHALVQRGPSILAQVDYSHLTRPAYRDRTGRALFQPPERRNYPACCQGCPQLPVCEHADRATTTALAWRQLGLVEPDGTPARRGRVFRMFQHGEGLALAAGLEDPDYAVDDLLYDLANLRAGPRFVPEGDNPHAGRLAARCQQLYRRAEHPGYLAGGVPPDYGDGAAMAVFTLLHEPARRHNLLNDLLRPGDLERALTEWRSLLRQLATAPADAVLDVWPRWSALKTAARETLALTPATSVPTFPPLLPSQTRRYEHRLR